MLGLCYTQRSLAVDRFTEPDLRASPPQPAVGLVATVTVGQGTHPNATLVHLLHFRLLSRNGGEIDFVYLRSGTAMPGRRSGDQVHKVF